MMGEWMNWFAGGGPVQVALAGVALLLGFLLSERLFAVEADIRAVREGRAEGVDPVRGHRRLGIIRACIVVAPLLGLLGTVSGMIETFDGVLAGGYLQEMSGGISTALITTQYGLAIAVPGLLLERVLLRRGEKLAALRASAGKRTTREET